MTKCIVKAHSKNGILTRIEGDDTVNATTPREDIDLNSIKLGRIQSRPCSLGVAWQGSVYDPNRILYPMQQIGAKGSGQFQRITWTQALDTIYQQLVNANNKYGPNSIWTHPLASYVGAGMAGWGENSYSGFVNAEYIAQGMATYGGNCAASESDIFNTKLILMFGAFQT